MNAEKRRNNIIIKGLDDYGRENDDKEITEILETLFCRHRIGQITHTGRLGHKRNKNRLLMVTFENEQIAEQVYSRRHYLAAHNNLYNVYIMKDLPRSERRHRRASNTLNEAANSNGTVTTQGNSVTANLVPGGATSSSSTRD